MAASQALNGFGTLFKRGDGAGPEVFTAIAEVVDITPPALSKDTFETTHHTSDDQYKEYLPGLRDAGEVSVTLNFLPGDTGQEGLLSDFNSNTKRNFQIVLPDAGTETWALSGFVTGYAMTTPLNDRVTVVVTIKPSGKPTLS